MASPLAGSKRPAATAGWSASPGGAGRQQVSGSAGRQHAPGAFSYEFEHRISSHAGVRTVRILYTSDINRVELWCRRALAADSHVLGLDTESPPNFRPGGSTVVTVLQVAYADYVLVIQLNALHGADGSRDRHHVRRSAALVELVSRPGAVLTGMGIAGDKTALIELLALQPAANPAVADLKRMAVDRGHAYPGGLGPLAETLLGVAKWKSKKLSLSRWGEWPLGERQVVYAAMDAWASCATHHALALLPVLPPLAPPPLPEDGGAVAARG